MKRILPFAILIAAVSLFVATTVVFAATTAAAVPSTAGGTPTVSYPTPQLNVNIPGVNFAAPTITDGLLSSSFIGTYVSGVFSYLLGFAMTVAIVFLMVGGVRYVIGGVSTESIKGAKKMMVNAIEGFVLLLFVFVILFTVNPATTMFKNLELTTVPGLDYDPQDTYATDGSASSGAVGTPQGANVFGGSKGNVPEELVSDIEAVARKMAAAGYGIAITDGLRSVAEQENQIRKNCQNPPGSSSCNPKVPGQFACVLPSLSASDCPHTSGYAVDMWGTVSTTNGNQSVHKAECAGSSGITKCRQDISQGTLISYMKAAGFCVLDSEPWHFEKPVFSKGSCH